MPTWQPHGTTSRGSKVLLLRRARRVRNMEVGWEERLRSGKSEVTLVGLQPHWDWQKTGDGSRPLPFAP